MTFPDSVNKQNESAAMKRMYRHPPESSSDQKWIRSMGTNSKEDFSNFFVPNCNWIEQSRGIGINGISFWWDVEMIIVP